MTFIFYFFSGVICWTFLEYFLHRFFGHTSFSFIKKSRFHKEHQKHHFIKNYYVNSLDKVIMALLLGLISIFLTQPYLGMTESMSLSGGLISMYLVYEIVHRRLHTHAPKHHYALLLRKHHLSHHFKNDKMNHGVTTPIWDFIFGTYQSHEDINNFNDS